MPHGRRGDERLEALRYLDKKVTKAIARFGLIEHGDRVLVAASGGKDSTCLLEVLAARRAWSREKYDLVACHVVRPGCTTEAQRLDIEARCERLDVPLVVRPHPGVGRPGPSDGPSVCFSCAWQRRRVLFETAAEFGCPKVALGHHLDDLAETVLMNLFMRGEVSTMYPLQEMFQGRVTIIRPLSLVEEKTLAATAAKLGFTPASSCEPLVGGQRARMKALLSDLRRGIPAVKTNLVRAALQGWEPGTEGHPRRRRET